MQRSQRLKLLLDSQSRCVTPLNFLVDGDLRLITCSLYARLQRRHKGALNLHGLSRSHGRCGHLSLTPPRLGQLKVEARLTRTGRLQDLVKLVIYLDDLVNPLGLTHGQRLIVQLHQFALIFAAVLQPRLHSLKRRHVGLKAIAHVTQTRGDGLEVNAGKARHRGQTFHERLRHADGVGHRARHALRNRQTKV